MRAEIIIIGDEILDGHTQEANSGWLVRELIAVGIEVSRIHVIGDRADAIHETVARSESQADVILVTGGLGPTSDDVTKQALAAYFGDELVLNEEVLADIARFLERRGRFDISARNRGQAYVPSRCTVLRNPVGTAPGMWFENNATVLVSMPGVPFEMREMATSQVLPRLKQTFELPCVLQRVALVFGVPEAELAGHLEGFEASLGDRVALAYLPSPSGVRLKLTARGGPREALQRLVGEKMDDLSARLGDDIVSVDGKAHEIAIGELLMERGATVSTAESCTGGSIARLLTSVPGSSRYYVGSIVSYSNDVKHRHLGVSLSSLEHHGAVSREVVEQMARGVLTAMGTDFAVATSGIAGPDGGTKEKPVGTTWIAAASAHHTVSRRYQFGELRGINIERSSYTALDMLRRLIIKAAIGGAR